MAPRFELFWTFNFLNSITLGVVMHPATNWLSPNDTVSRQTEANRPLDRSIRPEIPCCLHQSKDTLVVRGKIKKIIIIVVTTTIDKEFFKYSFFFYFSRIYAYLLLSFSSSFSTQKFHNYRSLNFSLPHLNPPTKGAINGYLPKICWNRCHVPCKTFLSNRLKRPTAKTKIDSRHFSLDQTRY